MNNRIFVIYLRAGATRSLVLARRRRGRIRYVHTCAPGQNGIKINLLTYLLIAVSDFVACEIEISCTIALLKLSLLYYTLLTVLI